MSEQKDLVIASTLNVPTGATKQAKPCYLVSLLVGKKMQCFIAIGEPKFEATYVQAKGFFVEGLVKEDDIIVNYQKLVDECDKSKMVEMWLPWHSISFVRSLVYKVK